MRWKFKNHLDGPVVITREAGIEAVSEEEDVESAAFRRFHRISCSDLWVEIIVVYVDDLSSICRSFVGFAIESLGRLR